MCRFVDMILVSVLYNYYNYCYQSGPKKLSKKLKNSITNEKKEIVEKYESGVPVTALATIWKACQNPPSQQSYRGKICPMKLALLKVLLKLGSHDQQC